MTVKRRLVVVVAAFALGACGLPADDDAQEIDDVPFGLDETTTTSSTTTTTMPAPTTTGPDPTLATTTTLVATEPVQVYFVIANDDLVSQSVQLSSPINPNQVLAQLEDGPVPGPGSVGLRTEVRPGLTREVTVDRGVATVDLVGEVLGEMTTFEGRNAIAQIVLSLRLPGIGQVRFTTDGEPEEIPVPANNNQLSEPGAPLAFEDFAVLLGPGATPTTAPTTPPTEPGTTTVPG